MRLIEIKFGWHIYNLKKNTRHEIEEVSCDKILTFFHSAVRLSCFSLHNTFCPVLQHGSWPHLDLDRVSRDRLRMDQILCTVKFLDWNCIKFEHELREKFVIQQLSSKKNVYTTTTVNLFHIYG